MCAVSPGASMAYQTPKEQSHISSYDQQHPANIQALQAFKSIIKSCYGPQGHLKMIQNQCGGHVTLTSSSQRLLSTLSLSKPVLKMLSAAVEGHLKVYSDGGLHAALLACSLIEGCWETGLHPMMSVAVNEVMQDICKKTMMSSDIFRIPINVASMETLLSLVRSVIASKPGCGLVKQDLHLIASLVVQSFISSIPSVDHGQPLTIPEVQVIGVEGEMPSGSHILEGILIEAPDIPAFYTKDLQVPRIDSGRDAGCIRVVLFNISLSGDSEEYADVGFELSPGLTAEASNLQAMRDLVDQLVDTRVGLVACQKVIHPSIKRYLRQKGILSIDRLSIRHIRAVQQVTGAEILGSFSCAVPPSSFGYVTDIKHLVVFGKSYLHLQSTSSLCTLVLCNHTEQSLEEMKHVCEVAHHTLALTLSNPTAVPGAGCLNVILAHHIREQVSHVDESIWRDIGCSKTQFLQLAEKFASCLEAVSMATVHDDGSHLVTDSTSHHSWCIPREAMADSDWLMRLGRCGCGMKVANQLKNSSWSIVGNLKYGVYRKEKQAAKEASRTVEDSNSEQENHARNVLHPTCSNRTAVQDEMSGHEPSKSQDGDGTGLILDLFAVRFNSFCVAVDIANVVLRIGHTIEDIN
ncbi:McKusick-Kaufman/Bardet-Biedl syndromes putative chaperonin-like isoform X2 [Strongylocentrotus purpuratus]|uniref:McKusick-Kaufman syndrome n=1 Tax=Strongylocentrotus purpuratus TaxID=7668 RepID=A0A7M7SVK5_STRPU|nr:McKusick-Kaufman/Bardet-Biedl syndromes putative chaperonin-like isoform X2 [Strongylocentrotus purpuratus]